MLTDLNDKLIKARNTKSANRMWTSMKLEEFAVHEPWNVTHTEHFSNIHPLEFNALLDYIAHTDNKVVVEQFKKLLTTAKLTMGERLLEVQQTISDLEERNAAIRKYEMQRMQAYHNACIEEKDCYLEYISYWGKLVTSIQLGIVQTGIAQTDFENLQSYKQDKNITIAQLSTFDDKDIDNFLRWVREKKKPQPPKMQTSVVPSWWSGAAKRIFERHRKAGKTD